MVNKESSNLVLFTLGKGLSVFGSAIYTFAIGLHVLKITGSGMSFATTLFLGLIPTIILNPFAGVLADKFNKKKIVVGMDILNGVLFILLYFLSLKYNLKLSFIYTSTFLTTVFTTLFNISFEAAKPNIVTEAKLLNINSVSKIIDSVSSILGPILGGLIFANVDIRCFILINGFSFIFSAITEIFIDFQLNYQECSNTNTSFSTSIKEGLVYIVNRKDIIQILNIVVALNFFLGFSVTVPLPFIINNVLNLSTQQFGLIQSSFPVGMIIGAIYVKKIMKKTSHTKILLMTSILVPMSMILLGLPLLLVRLNIKIIFYTLYYSIIMASFGIAIAFVDIPNFYLLQKTVPNEYRGRVLSVGISLGKIISPIAFIISGYLINMLPAYSLPISGGLLLFVSNIFIMNKNKIVSKQRAYSLEYNYDEKSKK